MPGHKEGCIVKPLVIVFLIFIVVYFIGTMLLRRYYQMKVEMLYTTGLYDDCFDTLNQFLPRILFPTYNQYVWRFMVHNARGERKMASRMIELMLRMRSSKKRHAQTVAMAFNYFVSIEDRKRAKELLAEGKQVCDESVIKDMQLTYDIMLGGRHDYIEKMEQLAQGAEPAVRAKLYKLIAKQYLNAGNRKQANYYEGLFKQLLEENAMPDPNAPAKSVNAGDSKNSASAASAEGETQSTGDDGSDAA